jgi:SAM-dependent methyltransferase
VSVDVALEPAAAFEVLIEELNAALRRRGIRFETGADGRLIHDGTVVGRVIVWEPSERCVLEWRPASWQPDQRTTVEIRVDAADDVSRLTVEQSDWQSVTGDDAELMGWFASEVSAPFLAAMLPAALGDWITDRRARRPSGAQARATYRDPLFHYPNFHAILAELALTPADYLVEVGCGGGAFLKMALQSGCRAVGVDYSPDMIEVARDVNADAIAAGRLEIVEANAASLPLPESVFTCAVITGVLGFLSDPVAALKELRRVLAPDGRAVVMGADPEDRDTPAAPEPMASRLRFYEEEDLGALARAAGFEEVRVVRRTLERYAREVGIPDVALPLFSGPGTRFLLVTKS